MVENNERAFYHYASGHTLLLPKTGNAALLFLEYIRDYTKEQKRIVQFSIKNAGDTNTANEDFFIIRMPHEMRGTFADAVSYINDNL